MPRRLLILPIAALLLVKVPAGANELLLGLFEQYLESLRRQAGIPGLAAVIVGEDAILWERGFGLQDVEAAIATRADTPFHVDGLTQVFTAALVLRCVEEGRLSLDERIGRFDLDSPDAGATVRQVLTHTSTTPDSLVFNYRPERLAPLAFAVRACTGDSYRETLGHLLDRFAMRDSVPGQDSVNLPPDAPGQFDPPTVERYRRVLTRLATPYGVDKKGRASRSTYATAGLSPSHGLISTARDLARFDIALRAGTLLRDDTLAAAWRNPVSGTGQPLPHGLGWFVQTYRNELIAWQFGVAENASSSIVVKVPGRGLTLILLANSDGLAAPFPLAAGDLTASPIGRLFLRVFVS